MDAAFVALFLELRFSFRRPIGAVGPHLVAGVGLVQDLIKLLAVVNGRIGLGIAPNDLVLAVDTDAVLVALEAFLILLRPASILVFLRILRWLLIPPLGRLARLDRLVLATGVVLLGRADDGGIDNLPTTGDVALGIEVSLKRSNSALTKPARASASLNSHTVMASGTVSSKPSPRN